MSIRSIFIQYWSDWLFGIIAAALCAGYRILYGRFRKTVSDSEAVTDGIRALLHERIISEGKRLIDKGYCTPEEFEEFEYLYKPYAALNGNGSAKRIREQVQRLSSAPVSEGAEADREDEWQY